MYPPTQSHPPTHAYVRANMVPIHAPEPTFPPPHFFFPRRSKKWVWTLTMGVRTPYLYTTHSYADGGQTESPPPPPPLQPLFTFVSSLPPFAPFSFLFFGGLGLGWGLIIIGERR